MQPRKCVKIAALPVNVPTKTHLARFGLQGDVFIPGAQYATGARWWPQQVLHGLHGDRGHSPPRLHTGTLSSSQDSVKNRVSPLLNVHLTTPGDADSPAQPVNSLRFGGQECRTFSETLETKRCCTHLMPPRLSELNRAVNYTIKVMVSWHLPHAGLPIRSAKAGL